MKYLIATLFCSCLSLSIYGSNNSDSTSIITILDSINVLKQKGEYGAILNLAKSARTKYHDLSGNKKSVQLARIYLSLSTGFLVRDLRDSSIHYSQKASELLLQLEPKDHPLLADAYDRQAKYYRSIGNFEKAIFYFEKAQYIALKNFGENHIKLSIFNNNMASVYLNQYKYQDALSLYKKTLIPFKDNFGEFHPFTLNAYNNIAISYSELGDTNNAFKHINIAKNIVESQGYYNAFSLRTYLNEGIINFRAHKYDQAIPSYLIALEHIQKVNPTKLNLDLSNTYYRLAEAYGTAGDFERSNEYFFKAIKANNYTIHNFESYDQVISLPLLLAQLGQKLDVLEIQYNSTGEKQFLDSLLNYSDYTLSLHKKLLSKVTFNNPNYFLSANYIFFEKAIHYFIESDAGRKSQAFQVAEMIKSKRLLDHLIRLDAKIQVNIPKSITAKEKQLTNEIGKNEKRLFFEQFQKKEPNEDTIQYYREILFDLFKNQDQLIDHIKNEYPRYHYLCHDTKKPEVQDIKSNLKSDEGLIEYFVGDSTIFIFYISKDDFLIKEIKKDFPLEQWVNSLRNSIYQYWIIPGQTDALYNTSNKVFAKTSHNLYDKLIKPISERLPKRLIIVPDGILNLVPFEALIQEIPSDPNEFASHAYLLNDHLISYDFSASKRWQEKRKVLDPKRKLIAFAPSFSENVQETELTGSVTLRDVLAPLKYNNEEAEKIGRLFDGDPFLGLEASKSNFLNLAKDYQIIHLATHGKANDKVGDFSYIAFSQTRDSISEADLLYVKDLFGLNFNADLVVLSACETGIGEVRKGEGVVSIARGFSYAGSESIITSLWNVYDNPSTVNFMESFYKKLKKGLSKDEALRAVKLETLNNPSTAAPYFWAGFIPIGDMTPIEKSGFPIPLFVVIGVILGIVLVFWLRRSSVF